MYKKYFKNSHTSCYQWTKEKTTKVKARLKSKVPTQRTLTVRETLPAQDRRRGGCCGCRGKRYTGPNARTPRATAGNMDALLRAVGRE